MLFCAILFRLNQEHSVRNKMKKLFAVVALFTVIATGTYADEWRGRLNELVGKGYEQVASATARRMPLDTTIIGAVASQIPDWQALARELQNRSFSQPEKRGELQLNHYTGIDGKSRPWVLYVPETYWHKRSTPLLVILHGGVSRAEISEDPTGWASESAFLSLARQNGWFAVFPFGQGGATWWDEVGMSNIRGQLHLVKENFNVDDDRVYLAGFSDGASGGFLHAMLAPDNFAAVVALNGHMGVGSLDGKLPTYVNNMANTPVYAVTTDKDGLYPTAVMSRTIEMAIEAGANVFYRQLAGTHSFDYDKTELPVINRFLDRNPRRVSPVQISWEAGSTNFGRCRWLEIAKILPVKAEPWHVDHNLEMVSDRITIGFMPETASSGVRVGKVLDETFAAKIGLVADDVIIGVNQSKIETLKDLDVAKEGVKRGDQFDLTLMRGAEKIELKGRLPEVELFNLFMRNAPSAKIIARQIGNSVSITGSRAGSLRLFIHPDQFNLAENIVVTYNGTVVFNDIVKPDLSFMLENYLLNRDRKMLPVAKISIDLQ
jgi:predicted esterase